MGVKIKPFQQQGNFTIFDNVILDHILPRISGSEWKILSVIIRKTVGWHKEQDELSFSQIRYSTGIKSDATVAKSLSNLERAGYIQVDRSDDQWASNIYALNLDFELDVESSPSENEAEPPTTVFEAATEIVVSLTTKNVVEPTTKNKVGPTTENEDTKEREKKRKRNKNNGANAPLPDEAKRTHLAIEAYRAVANRYPDKSTWEMITVTVGDKQESLDFWKDVVRNYIACGWNKINIKGMLEFFKKGILPTTEPIRNGGTYGQNQQSAGTNSKRSGIKGLRELGSDNPIKPIFDPSTGEDYYIDARTGQRVHPDTCPCFECQRRAELP